VQAFLGDFPFFEFHAVKNQLVNSYCNPGGNQRTGQALLKFIRNPNPDEKKNKARNQPAQTVGTGLTSAKSITDSIM